MQDRGYLWRETRIRVQRREPELTEEIMLSEVAARACESRLATKLDH